MTARAMAIGWLFSIGVVLSFFWNLANSEPGPEELLRAGSGAPVVVIGSSLMLFGLPNSPVLPDGLLGDGLAHWRLGLPNITESESLSLLNLAVDAGARMILLEANPFLYDRQPIVPEERVAPNWADVATGPLLASSAVALRFLENLKRGRKAENAATDTPGRIDREFLRDPSALGRGYPYMPRPPRNLSTLKAAVNYARENGVLVILVVPPRSELGTAALGPDLVDAIDARARDMAKTLDLPMFYPAQTWPDAYFIDHGHMNRKGRARFMQELHDWARTGGAS